MNKIFENIAYNSISVKALAYIILSMLLYSVTTCQLKSQILTLPDTANFFDYMDSYYSASNYDQSDTTEGGDNKHHQRLGMIWGSRLYPHGNFRVANQAIIDYATNFTPVNVKNEDPNWVCLGPSNGPDNSTENGVGQIHRITFDPKYDGVNNKTIYASSGHCGLWRTENDGALWENVNTDRGIPISSVADIAVHPDDTDTLFIGTGIPDNSINLTYGPNWGNTNPIYTIGVYRSLDYGQNWNPINTAFIDDFDDDGGTIRKLTLDMEDPDNLFAATSNGVYRTQNALAATPTWTNILSGTSGDDNDFRSVEFKPGRSDTLYAASNDIFWSFNGGDSWSVMTGETFGLNFEDLEPFLPYRINLAVTPADPDRLFAYIWGDDEGEATIYIYYWDGSTWTELYDYTGYVVNAWMGLAVSPVNEDEYYFYGYKGVWGTSNLDTPTKISDYIDTGVYADGHVLEYQPNIQSDPLLYFGHHAGVSVRDTSGSWSFINNGLENQLIWSFDDSNFESGVAAIANQDCYVYILEDDEWNRLLNFDVDSYSVKNSWTNPDLFLHSWGDQNLWSFDKSSSPPPYTNYSESSKRPFDGQYPLEKNRIVKTFKLISFPNDVYDYTGFCEVYRRNFDWPAGHTANVLWEIDSDIGKIEPLSHKRQIVEIDFCQSAPDTIYLATAGNFPSDDDMIPILAKTTSGGNNGNYQSGPEYEELDYPGNANDEYPAISGIAVHPDDPKKLWITLIGYDNISTRVAYSDDGGGTWSNADPNGSLPELPINGIVYQYGSNDVLYLATDVGVYYKDASMSNWEEYGEFPHVRVTELKINYCVNKLRVATYGRALWEGDLLASTNPVCYEIENNDTLVWDRSKALQTGVRVMSGGLLIIEDIINMPSGGKIIIEQGGKLVLDGGTLTNGCGETWQGIEVWGNPSATQTAANQGTLEIINGGTIEYAVVAVHVGKEGNTSFGGGIVDATNGNFNDNDIGVWFDPYSYTTNNASGFTNCKFDYTLTLNGESTFTHVKLNDVHHVDFAKCEFTNNSNYDHRGYGIYSTNSIFNVEGDCATYSGTDCIEWDYGIFENLNYGVYATASNTTDLADIRHTKFIENHHGIYLSGMTLPRVTSDSLFIDKTATLDGYGLYLDGCRLYWVEDNYFEGTGTSLPIGIGVYVNESGDDANEIYLNVFDYVEYAVIAKGENRDDRRHETGLQILCNDYNNTDFDETIIYDGTNDPPEDYEGIASRQGNNATGVEDMAGNIFYYNTTTSGDYDDINNESNHFYYYYSTNANNLPVEPLDYTTGTVTKVPKTTSLWTYDDGCPSTISSGGGGGGTEGLRSAMADAQSDIEATEAVLQALVDGGDTEALNAEVESSTPPEAAQVYNELMAESPNLSETVVESTIEKEEVIPNAMLRDVMVANPHTATSLQLLDMLDDRDNPMPAYMKAQILAGRSITSLKAELEGDLAVHTKRKAKAMNQIARYFGNMPQEPAATDSLLALYQDDLSLSSHYMQAWLHLQAGQYQAGQSVVTAIPTTFTLTDDETAEYQNMQLLYTMLKSLLQAVNSIDVLSTAQVSQLQSMVADETGFASVYARNILLALGESDYEEPVILPNRLKSTAAEEAYNELLNTPAPKMLEVYPNPGKDFVILGYQLDKESQGMIEIRDISGTLMQSIPFKGMQDQLTLVTTNWSPGIYVLSLVVGDKVLETTKFTLAN